MRGRVREIWKERQRERERARARERERERETGVGPVLGAVGNVDRRAGAEIAPAHQ